MPYQSPSLPLCQSLSSLDQLQWAWYQLSRCKTFSNVFSRLIAMSESAAAKESAPKKWAVLRNPQISLVYNNTFKIAPCASKQINCKLYLQRVVVAVYRPSSPTEPTQLSINQMQEFFHRSSTAPQYRKSAMLSCVIDK